VKLLVFAIAELLVIFSCKKNLEVQLLDTAPAESPELLAMVQAQNNLLTLDLRLLGITHYDNSVTILTSAAAGTAS
jgi:hypothetical protein